MSRYKKKKKNKNQTVGKREGDERDMRGEGKWKEDSRKNRMRREERVGEERREMIMIEPGVEIRVGRWDVKHQRRGWRILYSTLQTTQQHRRATKKWKMDLNVGVGRGIVQMDSVKDSRIYTFGLALSTKIMPSS